MKNDIEKWREDNKKFLKSFPIKEAEKDYTKCTFVCIKDLVKPPYEGKITKGKKYIPINYLVSAFGLLQALRIKDDENHKSWFLIENFEEYTI